MSWSTRRTESGSSRTPLSRRVLKGHRSEGDRSTSYNAEVALMRTLTRYAMH